MLVFISLAGLDRVRAGTASEQLLLFATSNSRLSKPRRIGTFGLLPEFARSNWASRYVTIAGLLRLNPRCKPMRCAHCWPKHATTRRKRFIQIQPKWTEKISWRP